MSDLELTRAQVCALLEIDPFTLNTWDRRGYLDEEGARENLKKKGAWRRYDLPKIWMISLMQDMMKAGVRLEIASSTALHVERFYYWPVLNPPQGENHPSGIAVRAISKRWEGPGSPEQVKTLGSDDEETSLGYFARAGAAVYLPFAQNFRVLLRLLKDAEYLSKNQYEAFYNLRPDGTISPGADVEWVHAHRL